MSDKWDDDKVGEGPEFDRELPKAGACVARVWRSFNVGLQPGYQGGEPKPTVVVYFILPHTYSSGPYKGKRMLLNQKYKAGFGKFETVPAKRTYLRRDVEAILNRPLNEFEVKGLKLRAALDGAPCMIQIVHENGYANIKTIMSIPDGVPGPVPNLDIDPAPDYIPSYITKLRAQAVVQERVDTDKIAERGWEAGKAEKEREPTPAEADIF
jgi:hypothetical protein